MLLLVREPPQPGLLQSPETSGSGNCTVTVCWQETFPPPFTALKSWSRKRSPAPKLPGSSGGRGTSPTLPHCLTNLEAYCFYEKRSHLLASCLPLILSSCRPGLQSHLSSECLGSSNKSVCPVPPSSLLDLWGQGFCLVCPRSLPRGRLLCV